MKKKNKYKYFTKSFDIMITITLLIFGMWSIMNGFHTIDLDHNYDYLARQENFSMDNYVETTIGNQQVEIRDLYRLGWSQLWFGAILLLTIGILYIYTMACFDITKRKFK